METLYRRSPMACALIKRNVPPIIAASFQLYPITTEGDTADGDAPTLSNSLHTNLLISVGVRVLFVRCSCVVSCCTV